MNIKEINLNDYNYDLPDERIAQYPAEERDMSRLLINKNNIISSDSFRNIENYIPENSLIVFNNTRVIRARILFRKETGAVIEILCLEPLSPVEYALSFSSKRAVEWKCIIGNLKKWKSGVVKTMFIFKGDQYVLTAKRVQQEGDAWRVRFDWGTSVISFGEVIDSIGLLPLPPYIDRDAGPEDLSRYQTVYSSIKGSVAAPTAGLHFTDKVLEGLKQKGVNSAEVTLHVGAGTFKPIKSKSISGHEMHCEHFFVSRKTIELLIEYNGRIIPVGTTSVRTLESLYWLGVKLLNSPEVPGNELILGQWEAYELDTVFSTIESMRALLNHMHSNGFDQLQASTSIMIIPGYNFRMISGMVTNFHQPGSTLLLLISAWIGDNWKKVYRYALDNKFRFLSYGDCSLLFR